MITSGPIVLVEDDIDDQEIIAELSRELLPSNELRIFHNGRTALDFLSTTNEQPFIILCDVNMPVMDGLQFRQQINSSEYLRNKSIPFIFLSTSGDAVPVKKAYELNVQGFFKKPNELGVLRHILHYAFEYWKKSLHPNNAK